MRLLLIAAACALAAAGSATAQTKGFAPYTAPQASQTTQTASPPEPTSRPTSMAGGAARPMTASQPTPHHGAMRHETMRHETMRHGMRHHGMRRDHMRGHRGHGDHRTHSAGYCVDRAKAHHRTGRGATHAIQRCEAGRPHRHHGHHHGQHHGMAHHGMRHAAGRHHRHRAMHRAAQSTPKT